MNRQINNSALSLKVRQLVKSTGMPLGLFSDAIHWKAGETLDWWSHRKECSILDSNLRHLSEFLGVSQESIVNEAYDVSLLRRRILSGPSCLPERYAQNASSYVRTSLHIIEYLSMLYGRHLVDTLLRDLNIHPLFFDNMENRFNLNFYVDFFNRLSRLGIKDQDISALACYIFLSLKHTEIGQKFKKAQTHSESYTILAENATSFETNFDYEFEIRPERIRIIARPTEFTFTLLKSSPELYERLFLYRKNVFGWFPTLSELSPLTMSIPYCVLRGDPFTVYESEIPKGLGKDHGKRRKHLSLIS